jgi:hypothetical protein
MRSIELNVGKTHEILGEKKARRFHSRLLTLFFTGIEQESQKLVQTGN